MTPIPDGWRRMRDDEVIGPDSYYVSAARKEPKRCHEKWHGMTYRQRKNNGIVGTIVYIVEEDEDDGIDLGDLLDEVIAPAPKKFRLAPKPVSILPLP